jgi:hypothetical protein
MSLKHKRHLLIYLIPAFLFFCLLVLIALVAWIHFADLASLKLALNISKIPKSVKHLRSSCDVLAASESDYFYFTIAPKDFAQLLAGRNYLTVTNETLQKARTHDGPTPVSSSGHICYSWQSDKAGCTISMDDSNNQVFVIYGSN